MRTAQWPPYQEDEDEEKPQLTSARLAAELYARQVRSKYEEEDFGLINGSSDRVWPPHREGRADVTVDLIGQRRMTMSVSQSDFLQAAACCQAADPAAAQTAEPSSLVDQAAQETAPSLNTDLAEQTAAPSLSTAPAEQAAAPGVESTEGAGSDAAGLELAASKIAAVRRGSVQRRDCAAAAAATAAVTAEAAAEVARAVAAENTRNARAAAAAAVAEKEAKEKIPAWKRKRLDAEVDNLLSA